MLPFMMGLFDQTIVPLILQGIFNYATGLEVSWDVAIPWGYITDIVSISAGIIIGSLCVFFGMIEFGLSFAGLF